MCLITNQKPKKTWFRKKKVFKVFYLTKDEILITPYQFVPTLVGDTIKAKDRLPKNRIGDYNITSEGVHACVDIPHAITVMCNVTNNNRDLAKFVPRKAVSVNKVVICECEIPRFTKYVYGFCGDVASERLKIRKIIEEHRI